ncbi:MAG: hypothetical protein WBM53_18730 [Maribacter sp.]
MPLREKLINLKYFVKNNKDLYNANQNRNYIRIGLEEFEESMFIGSIFCSDLSSNQKKEVTVAQNSPIVNAFNRRYGVIIKDENSNIDNYLKSL